MIIWIASYPKSGNTWIRSMLSSYLYTESGKFTFETLKKIERFSVRNKKINGTKYQSQVSKEWIPTQEFINKDNKIHFLKTHNAMCSINQNKFTDKNNTKAAIYIVRDPRNVITSISNHYEFNIDESLDFLTNKRKIIFPNKNENNETLPKTQNDFNFLGDWQDHYLSWKDIGFCPVKIIKYEDILSDPKKIFTEILIFLSKLFDLKIDYNKIDNSISTTSFQFLSNMENKQGFEEAAFSSKEKKKIKFFNLGQKNDWRKILDKKIAKKMEIHFKNVMSELNYL